MKLVHAPPRDGEPIGGRHGNPRLFARRCSRCARAVHPGEPSLGARGYEGSVRNLHRSLTEEIDRVSDYYSERKGDFWVAVDDQKIVGMFGLEPSNDGAMELRRMYVDPGLRRRGIARKMLDFAEQECRRRNRPRMDLSTSEFQREALALYQNAGYERVHEEVAAVASNKALGGGIRRYHFTKAL